MEKDKKEQGKRERIRRGRKGSLVLSLRTRRKRREGVPGEDGWYLGFFVVF